MTSVNVLKPWACALGKSLLRMNKGKKAGTSLAVQWLGFGASITGGMGLISGQGTKIPRAAQSKKKNNNNNNWKKQP